MTDMKIVIIDNYDSFTYNLAHLVKALGADVDVFRNDKFALESLSSYDKIILSPGPGIPSEAGLLEKVVKHCSGKKPILGIRRAPGNGFSRPYSASILTFLSFCAEAGCKNVADILLSMSLMT